LALVLNARAQTALRQGDLTRAVELVREALLPRGEMPDAWFASRSLRTLAYVALQQGDAEQAVTLLSGSDALLTSLGASLPHRERPEFERAVAMLRGLIPDDRFALAWQAGHRMTLAEAVNYTPAATTATHAPRIQIAPDPLPIAPAPNAECMAISTTPALLVNALGPLQIYRDGIPVPSEAWASAKPREVLLFLLCHPEGCTKEQIGLALWPDASSAQVRNSFHNTLHRLRKTLGEGEWISYAGDRYRVEPPGGCEFDASSFEREVGAALRDLQSAAAAAPRLQKGLALYRGDFLEHEVVGDWHLAVRDRLQRLHLEGLSALGEHFMRAEQYALARDVYQRLLLSDDLNEEAYRRLMICLAHLGERRHALRLYQRLLVLLEDELSTTPEPETTELFELLQRGQAA
jgi:DNA-binding SARP family transcriptional activator